MKYIYELHKKMLDFKVILAYEGEVSQDITRSVLSMAERNLESLGEQLSTKKKVFNVMVECLQNIVKHSDEMQNINDEAVFLIGMEHNNYIVASGNYMYTKNVPILKSKIEQVNNLDKDGLKQLYRDVIRNGSLSEKGGAGLGFIDMARKSGNKLEYNFQKLDDKYTFFSLKTTITRKPLTDNN